MKEMKHYLKSLIRIIAIVMSLFQLYTGATPFDPLMQRYIHLTFGLVLVFLIYRLDIKGLSEKWALVIDSFLALVVLASMGYLLFNFDYVIVQRFAYITPVSWLEKFLGVALIILVLEGTRRLTGWALPILALVAVAYPFIGPYLPGLLGHGGYPFERIIDVIYLSTDGIFGIALAVSAAFVMLYIIFGAFLTQSGLGKFIVDFSQAYVGHLSGGPAKVAIVGSGLMGMLSGSPVGNVATTGSFTIPMMKKLGYKPHYAGAVEALASSGGIIMPPVMGSVAFVMSQLTAIPYGQIIMYAVLPAVLFYLSIFIMVHLEAVKCGIKGLPKDQLPSGKEILIKNWNLTIPIFVLIYFLIQQYTATMAVIYSILSLLIVVQLRPSTRMGWRQILQALEDGARGALVVIMAVATAGIIVGMLNLTGLAIRFTGSLVVLSGGSLLALLVLSAFSAMVMGMGLPGVVSYIILAALVAPSLVKLGIPVVVAHFFIIYYSVTAFFTPPFCTAVYVASGIAGSPIMKTGYTAMKMGLAVYIVPFMFVYGPELLGIGTPVNIIIAFIAACIGIILLAAAVEGFFRAKMAWYERIIALVGALLMIKPGIITDSLGLVCLGIVLLIQRATVKREVVENVSIVAPSPLKH